jgi:hypothetical protein
MTGLVFQPDAEPDAPTPMGQMGPPILLTLVIRAVQAVPRGQWLLPAL